MGKHPEHQTDRGPGNTSEVWRWEDRGPQRRPLPPYPSMNVGHRSKDELWPWTCTTETGTGGSLWVRQSWSWTVTWLTWTSWTVPLSSARWSQLYDQTAEWTLEHEVMDLTLQWVIFLHKSSQMSAVGYLILRMCVSELVLIVLRLLQVLNHVGLPASKYNLSDDAWNQV